jgi:hypothetical protein
MTPLRKVLPPFVLVLLSFSASAQKLATPPIPYEDHGACPFECCVYREWIANKITVLRADRRNNSPVIFTVRKSKKVTAITGVVITTRAGRAKMLRSDTIDGVRVKAGDILYVLTNRGEGFYSVWYKNRTLDYGLVDNPYVRLLNPPQSVWWVKIKNRKGQIGWSRQPENFDNKDECGHHRFGSVEHNKPLLMQR